jgi:hypothetical protein
VGRKTQGQLARGAHGRPSAVLDQGRASLCDLIRAREALAGEIFPRTDGVAQAHRLVLHAGLGRAFGADDEVDR